MYCRFRVAWTLALSALAFTQPALAADDSDAATRSSARKVAMDGVAALQQGNAEIAVQKLEKAQQILRVPSVGLWLARALRKRGHLVEASEHYLEASRLTNKGGEPAVQEQAQKDALKELDELTPLIPSLIVTVEGAPPGDVSVTIDDKPIPAALLGEDRPVNPGAHQIKGQHGSRHAEQAVTLAVGEKKTLVLRFGAASGAATAPPRDPSAGTPAPAESGSTAGSPPGSGSGKTLAYVALAAGGAGLAVGGVTGFLAMGKRDDLDQNPNCREGKCLPVMQSDVDSFRMLRTVSTIGFIAGGVFAATGVVLLVSGSGKQRGAREGHQLALHVAPGDVSLTGSF